MPNTAEQWLRLVNAVQEAHELLDCPVDVDTEDSQRAREIVVELKALINELRSLGLPRTFRGQRKIMKLR
jgi:hypothetical protein